MILSNMSCHAGENHENINLEYENEIEYISYHESNPLESEIIIKIYKTGRVTSLVKKLKPFSKNPHKSSSWQNFKEDINLDPEVFINFRDFLKNNNFSSSSELSCPGTSSIDIKTCFGGFNCKSIFLSSIEDHESFVKIKQIIDILIISKLSYFKADK
ncbi:MAG: hypothetical protein ACQESF_07315 [Nanobdellota archaeon]